MKANSKRALALILAAALSLSACGNTAVEEKPAETPSTPAETTPATPATPAETKGEEITDLYLSRLATRELESFNILSCETAAGFENLTNLVDGLLETNPEAQLSPCLATEWGSEDGGLTWNFKLREGVQWVDMNGNPKAEVTSQDFLTGLEWILNFHKNDSANTTMPMEMLAGAADYYEYTKNLTAEEAYALNAAEGSKFQEMVGIKAADAYNLTYTCLEAKPYFDTVCSYACLYPMAQAMVDELGIDGVKAMNNETMWYNGAYTMTTYVQGNEKIFTPNPLYWDTDAKLFDSVNVKMVESNDVAYQLYQNGEIDYVALTESNLKTIYEDANHKFHDNLVEWPSDYRSYQFHLNYSKNNEDGTEDTNWNTAVANLAFRQSWYYGLNLVEYFKRSNTINPMSCENNFYTTPELIFTSNGTEYTELVREKLDLAEENGETQVRLDAEKFAALKAQAMEELTALGVTFPVEIDYYISASSQTALDSANVLANVFSNSLGDDYVKLNICTYVSSASKEVYTPKLHSFNISGWSADYGDPQNYLGQETYGNDSAYYSRQLSKINDVVETEATADLLNRYKEYTALVDAANAICDDLDARYEAYAEAEAYLIKNCLTIPCNYSVGWVLTKIDPNSKINARYGSCNEKMKNWVTNSEGYTTEELA